MRRVESWRVTGYIVRHRRLALSMDARPCTADKLDRHARLTVGPVFTALRAALHTMAAVLAVVVAVRAVGSGGATSVAAVALAALWLAIYASSMVLVRSSRAGWWWLAALSLVWLACLSVSGEACTWCS